MFLPKSQIIFNTVIRNMKLSYADKGTACI